MTAHRYAEPAALIAGKFGNLQHTNKRGEVNYLYMPGFKDAGMSTEQSESTGLIATGLAEALLETLDTQFDYVTVHRSQVAESVEDEAESDPDDDVADIHCDRCRQVFTRLDLSGADVVINVSQLAALIEAHREVCR